MTEYSVEVNIEEHQNQGVTFPTLTSLIAYWSPEFERSRISSVIFSGTWVGTVISLSVSGWLCSMDFLGGWPSAFYVFGTISCIWFSLWCIFVYETPFKHPHISKQELLLFKDIQSTSKIIKMPWCDMLTSIPFWILLVAFIGQYFANIFLLLELPTYLNNVFHINVEKNRTLYFSAGYALSLAFIAIPLSGCQFSVIVTLLCLGWFINGSHMSGFNIVTVELCPDFSATVYGICNGIGSLTGIVAPNLVGVLTKSGPTVANWGKVFYITASLLSITTTLFALFASAEEQHWGEARYTKGIRKSQVNTSVAMETKNTVNI
ncbi:vesicular glutamate transporter 3 [Caerostris extrusa]|uniref:Vesicular glutamate transporter 3 n=1 Tax=Caerostris extrusa TaxID=172846 RepID=A0AAV4XV83_CAEEX|nr:vesicular glutamate transporter 3 [Caerostris extrusa]